MNASSKKYLIVIVGPTAVGKTELSVKIAEKYNTVILNADSRQIYKELAIGTAKPTPYEMGSIKHHFVNMLSLSENYNAGKFEKDALIILSSIYRENNIAVLSGGSGLYIDAVSKGFDVLPKVVPGLRKDLEEELNTKGLDLLVTELLQKDPEYGNEVDLKNPQRILRALEIIRSSGEKFSALRKREIKPRPFLTIKIGLNRERDELYRRIDKRMDIMLETGLLEEAKKYVNFRNCNALKTVGYKEIYHYLDKEYDWDEAVRLLKRNTRRIAKRQLTWFRKDAEITWFHPSQEKEIINHIDKHIGKTN